ncbi:MAG: type 3 dihydrofolate reductase [bacterium]
MIISIIVAMSLNRVIGKDNKLPWHLSADLKHFKELTTGHSVIMGRKTYESIGKPLPKRVNIVLSRNTVFPNDVITVKSLQEALAMVEDNQEVFIMGGASVYQEALPLASKIYLTFVQANITGDTYFPEIDMNVWQEVKKHNFPSDQQNPYCYSFVVLQRILH